MNTEDLSRHRLAGVDVLRGLCILSVVLHHIHLRFTTSRDPRYPVNDVLPETLNQVLFWSGLYAVIAFFVISGISHHRAFDSTVGRVGKRSRGALLSHANGAHPSLPDPGADGAQRSAFSGRPGRQDVFRPRPRDPGAEPVRGIDVSHELARGPSTAGAHPAWGILWSLSIEEVFYLAFPLVCLMVRSEKFLPWALLVLIVAGPINRVVYADDQPWGAYAYLSCMDGMAFGCLAALVSARVTLSERVLRVSLVAGAIIAMLVVVFCNEDDYHAGIARFGLNFTLLEIGVALMLVPLGKGIGNRTMSIGTSWLRALGRWSYEIYLFHMLPLIGLMIWFKQGERSGAVFVATYVVMLAASIALGFLVSRYFSEPLNRRLRGNLRGKVPDRQ